MGKKVEKIDTAAFTEYMIMEMWHTLDYYDYIQRHYEKNDAEFQRVFTEFYGLNGNGQMSKNKDIYFKKLQEVKEDDDLIEIVEDFYKNMERTSDGSRDYQFSFSTKLLHTKNPDMPIFDSRVEQYLKEQEGVTFWNLNYERKDKEGKTKIGRIGHNWNELIKWSDNSLKEEKWKKVLQWFNKTFPEYAHISDVKKIDTTIYVWVKSTT